MQSELEQTRNTLKSMEVSDGHAVKVAMGRQKQSPEKARYLFLEEAMTNANKDRHFLKEESSSAARSHSNIPSSQSTASFASHHSMKSNTLRENPTRDLKQLLHVLSSVVSEEPPVPLGKTEEDGRTLSLGVSHVAVSKSSLRDSTHSSKSIYSLSHLHAANQRLRRAHVQSADAPSPQRQPDSAREEERPGCSERGVPEDGLTGISLPMISPPPPLTDLPASA
ncbi:hypothetical protein MC885_003788 [Smutsia gigantea]|nr:hypothetical protein MC885_003788 [Smutsia gigantea]